MADEMRKVFADSMRELMRENGNVVVLGADLNRGSGMHALNDEFPDRVINVGVAEQNMTAVAAGLAAYGMVPFINTFAAFASRRSCDQVAISVSYAELNVKIVGTDPGIAAELNGGTHMAVEDIGVLRSIPNIMIVEPSDAVELRQMIPAIASYNGPVYMRLYRKELEDLHGASYRYEPGKADILKEGSDVTIIASGIMVSDAVKAAQILAEKGIDAEVINIHTIKPIDKEAVVASARKTGAIVTAENHNILGGLRSTVAEVVTEGCPVRIYPIGIKNTKGIVGKLPYLKEKFGMTVADIVDAVERVLKE